VAGLGANYTPTDDDAGQELTCTVTASNSGGTSQPASVDVGNLSERPLTLTPLTACGSAGQLLRLVDTPSCSSGSLLSWNNATPGPVGPPGPPGAAAVGKQGSPGQNGTERWPQLYVHTQKYFGTGRSMSGSVMCAP
jgi:hypothetical protein